MTVCYAGNLQST